MKKYLLILMVGFVGCNIDKDSSIKPGQSWKSNPEIVVVDTCEYVVFTNEYSYEKFVVHSGNCHNPNHKKVNN